jgi:NAD(P) transhydrogenase subunit beta
MTVAVAINLSYLIATILFILGIKKLSSPATARHGNLISACGMLLAVGVTLAAQGILGVQGIIIDFVFEGLFLAWPS